MKHDAADLLVDGCNHSRLRGDEVDVDALITTPEGVYNVRVRDGQTTLVTPDPFRWAAYAN